MIQRDYQFVANEAQVDAAGIPPRPASMRVAGCVYWLIPETELADVPVMRLWLREHGVTEVREYGDSAGLKLPSSSLEEPYYIAERSWTDWKGPELTRLDPCEGCGLGVNTVAPPTEITAGQISHIERKLVKRQLISLPPPRSYVASSGNMFTPSGGYVASPDLVEALRSANLDEGLVVRPLDSRGRALLIWSDIPLGGPAYPYGPSPCATCGRAASEFAGEREWASPNNGYGLTFEAKPAHWSWSTVYGQQTPLVSYEVANFLLSRMPKVRPRLLFGPSGRPDSPDAFLAPPYR